MIPPKRHPRTAYLPPTCRLCATYVPVRDDLFRKNIDVNCYGAFSAFKAFLIK